MIIETQARMVAKTSLKVLLLEDDHVTREVLAMALEGMGHEVHTEPDGRWVDRAVDAFRPDVALIGMRVGHGLLRTAKRLRAHEGIPFLFLTAAGGVEDVIEAFEVGGDDYVVKPFVMAELQDRMRAVLRRAGRGAPSVLRLGDLCIDVDAHAALRAGYPVELTHREFSLLLLLCRHPGVVLSKARVLTEVWGSSDHYDVNVVEVHMSALRRKLEEHGPRVIHTVRGVGYVLRES